MNKWSRPVGSDRSAKAPKGRSPSLLDHHYFAFLSYSHVDSADADWLHRELERFRVPKSLAGRLTSNGVIPDRLTPIFRDRQELAAAHDLSAEINQALLGSRCLIVLCSPAAARSKWANAEVEAYKRAHPDGCIIAAIIGGEPFASEVPGREHEECFPAALRYKFDRRGRATGQRAEPLASDLRESADGRRLGFLKIVAGILGLGLDDLVQRDLLRRQRRLATIAAGSLGGMILAFLLALTAITARDEARDQRRAAESLVEFMLGDLKDKLEPIGRLAALDGVGSRVLDYYSHQNTKELSDEALAQRSKALTLLGRIADARGNVGRAQALFRQALAGTAEALDRDPANPQRLFDHAQNVWYLADSARLRGDKAAAETGMLEYRRLAVQMARLEPNNLKWRMEEQYADWNLAILFYEQRRFEESTQIFRKLQRTVVSIAALNPSDREAQQAVPETMAWFADSLMSQGKFDEAIALRERNIVILGRLLGETNDASYRQKLIPAHRALAGLYSAVGKADRAEDQLRSAVAHADRLVQFEPGNSKWVEFGYKARFNFAQILLLNGKTAAAEAETTAGCDSVARLMAKSSNEPTWRAGTRDCLMMRAQIALSKNLDSTALGFAQQAVAMARSVKTSDRVKDSHALAQALRVVGDINARTGKDSAARSAWSAALSALPANVAERPFELAERATIFERAGRDPDARQIRSRLDGLGFKQSMLIMH
jgi:tetratricopeptide (TPR) repeat protein